MVTSRFRRHEERRLRKRFTYAVVGTVGLVILVIVFGLKILVNFSLLVDRLRGGSSVAVTNQPLILPPVIDPVPEATNSAKFNLTGRGTPGLTLIVYLNEEEAKKLTVAESGEFAIPSLTAKPGNNTVSAKLMDELDNTSELSNVVSFVFNQDAPIIEVTSPEDNAMATGENNILNVSGKVDGDVTVTVNGRFVVILAYGSFSYPIALSEGENIITIVATNPAGNRTTIERRVTYQK